MEHFEQRRGNRVLRLLIVCAMLVGLLAPGFVQPEAAEAAITSRQGAAECLRSNNKIQVISGVYSTKIGDPFWSYYAVYYRPTDYGSAWKLSFYTKHVQKNSVRVGWNWFTDGWVQAWPGYDWKVVVYHWNGTTAFTPVPMTYYMNHWGYVTQPSSYWGWCSL